MRFAHQFARFRKLSTNEQRFLIDAVVSLPAAWIGLRLLGLARIQARLMLLDADGRAAIELRQLQRYAKLLGIAARHTFGPSTCLSRSLVLVWLLKRRGVQTQLRIGVRLNDGKLDAHAWVEHGGLPVNERQEIVDRYVSFPHLPPANSFGSR